MSSAAITPVVPDVYFVDRSDRGRLRLTGRDRQTFLQGMVTNDIVRLAPGDGCYAFQLDATGHVLADMRVLCAEDHLLLDVEPGLAPQVAATLEKYLIMEHCRIADVTSETAQIFIGGANAPALLEELTGLSDLADWPEGRNVPIPLPSGSGLLAATWLVPASGFDLYLPDAAALDSLTARLAEAGALPVGAGMLESLRIEAGIPRFGIDMDARVLAPETGQAERAISRRKGCYIGQEIVARIDARGHTNRAWSGFRLDPGIAELPAPGTPVQIEEGREVGRITSVAVAPNLGYPVALGYIRNDSGEPGTNVVIDSGTATVAALPFAETTVLETSMAVMAQ